MEIKEKYTLTEATKILGFKSKSTLTKRRQKGDITGELEGGILYFSHVDLDRVFPEQMKEFRNKIERGETFDDVDSEQKETHEIHWKFKLLEKDLQHERETRERLESQIKDLKTDKERLEKTLDEQSENHKQALLMLTSQIENQEDRDSKRGWWFFGRTKASSSKT